MKIFLPSLISLLLVACGGNTGGGGGGGGGACSEADPSPECGTTCTLDGDCADNLFCSTTGECTSECGSDADCGDGQVCSSRGRCIQGNDEDPACATIDVNLAPEVPTVVFLLDHSSSMDSAFTAPDGGASLRWTEMQRALTGIDGTGGVLNDFATSVVFGATFYDSDDGNANPPCPALVKIATGDGVASSVFSQFTDASYFPASALGLDTPTPESLAETYSSFPAGTTPTAPRVVVLATDGDPDTCEDPDNNGQAAPRTASETNVVTGFGMGIQTFVISVGADTEETHLNRMARAGVGQDMDTGTATAIVATNSAALGDAFQDIIRGVRTCIINVNGQITAPDSGVIELNGTPLEFATDWQLVDPSTIELVGAACTTFLETDEVQLSARFPCDGVVVQ